MSLLKKHTLFSQKVNKGQTLFLVSLLSIFLYNTRHFFRQSITCFFQKHKLKFFKNEKNFYNLFFKNADSNFSKPRKIFIAFFSKMQTQILQKQKNFEKGFGDFSPTIIKKSARKVEHSFYKISQLAIQLLCLQKVKERVCFSSRMGCRGEWNEPLPVGDRRQKKKELNAPSDFIRKK